MEIELKDYRIKENIVNLSISNENFIGITGQDRHKLIEILSLEIIFKGKIFVNNEEVTKNNLSQIKKFFSIIKENLEYLYFDKVYELMEYEIRRKNLKIKNPNKKILDSLKIVSLNSNILERTISTLSSSEKKLLQLAISLLANPEIIIINEPFKYLDIKNEKKLLMLLQKIKEQYKKMIIFVSKDSTMLYKYTNKLIIFKNDQIVIDGNTQDIFQRVDFLKKNKIQIPEIVQFTYLAKKRKNVKLEYHKDIRDIIKDIYKHV